MELCNLVNVCFRRMMGKEIFGDWFDQFFFYYLDVIFGLVFVFFIFCGFLRWIYNCKLYVFFCRFRFCCCLIFQLQQFGDVIVGFLCFLFIYFIVGIVSGMCLKVEEMDLRIFCMFFGLFGGFKIQFYLIRYIIIIFCVVVLDLYYCFCLLYYFS